MAPDCEDALQSMTEEHAEPTRRERQGESYGSAQAAFMPTLQELIRRAPWREAVTWRDTWPHEYVLVRRDNQRPLLEAICKRLNTGEGVDGQFYGRSSTYLFIGEHEYWVMTPCAEMDLDSEVDYVINRARLYRDRRDFVVE